MKFRYWLLPVDVVFTVKIALAEGIATDGTITHGVTHTLDSSNTIPQDWEHTEGNNLFHSFSDFNINTGQIVTFTGADNLQNVSSLEGVNNSV